MYSNKKDKKTLVLLIKKKHSSYPSVARHSKNQEINAPPSAATAAAATAFGRFLIYFSSLKLFVPE